jgi:phosphoglycerol transferase MdoB-like AlkP superfamily enzyme
MKRLLAWSAAPVPLGAAVKLFLLFMTASAITRAALGLRVAPMSVAEWLRMLLVGAGYDATVFLYAATPLILLLVAAPRAWHRRTWFRAGLAAGAWLAALAVLLLSVSEWIFWDEFESRFNFIAVDYLVYTREVLGNILQSYPVGPIMAGLAMLAAGVAASMGRVPLGARLSMRRLPLAAAWMTALAVTTLLVDHSLKDRPDDRYLSELSGSGLYELAAAFRHNELDYARFYKTIPELDAYRALREELATPDARFVSEDPRDITRDIVNPGPEHLLNVVLVSVESLSAEFVGAFGGSGQLTPNLDRLAREGLVFSQVYATGTRTVRGLEALTLSVPPTPGQSIVRRPDNANLFSLATVFAGKGYDRKYLYGGYAYFDNMSTFFGSNGYQVVDRRAIPASLIHHETVWGVADEDLYGQALREMRASHEAGRRFFVHVMTTSNHRPFTYPEGRIDIPSGSGRAGAVKYTDWAIGQFIAQAAQEPWFARTLFVFVADHQAASSGKTGLPVERYRIPLIVYAPGFVAPATVNRLMSQIDVAPTVLGLLGFSYRSRFLGWDVLRADPSRDRAFVSTYQELGFVDSGRLVALRPRRAVSVGRAPVPQDGDDDDTDESLVTEAIGWYEAASMLYRRGGLAALDAAPQASASLR